VFVKLGNSIWTMFMSNAKKWTFLCKSYERYYNQSIISWCYCKKEEKIDQVCYLFPLIIWGQTYDKLWKLWASCNLLMSRIFQNCTSLI